MEIDPIYMQRALELARLGLGFVSPNPLVGCVIAYRDNIIGEGWHMQYGGPHAEVNAVNSVQDKSLLHESVVYVTLEPCSHYGKTPPCADLLIRSGVKKVAICNRDINPLVAGAGLQRLRQAGIDVEENLLSVQGQEVNKRFFTFFRLQRPYIILKWAETADGFMAHENFDSKWISNELSRKLAHKWRSEEDAVMVGTNTARYDNPHLNTRDWEGKNPTRIVIDRRLRLSEDLNLFDRSQPTLVYNLLRDSAEKNLELIRLSEDNFLKDLFASLYEKKIQSVMVEGGARLLSELIALDLWDEMRVFRSKNRFGKGIASPGVQMNETASEDLLDDRLYIYKNY